MCGTDGGLLEKVERALEGHRSGDVVVEVTLNPDEGFGEYEEALTYTDDIGNVPPEFRHVGAEVEMENEHGESQIFRVSRIENGRLTVDGNHPLPARRWYSP
jgi:FKBP-type peptidyl-prolyl cis-trans isomerase SlyD